MVGSANTTQEPGATIADRILSTSPLAREVVARDVAHCTGDEDEPVDTNVVLTDSESEDGGDVAGPTLYRRPAGIAYGSARPALSPNALEEPPMLTPLEIRRSREAERSLLRDNRVLPPEHTIKGKSAWFASLVARLFSTKFRKSKDEDEEASAAALLPAPTEATSLLRGDGPGGNAVLPGNLNQQWDAAVAAGQIQTTWQREVITLTVYSRSLILTFLLQYSINVASIFAVGHLGSVELGAVSLAAMTANITCYAPFQGLATSLDTLCAQAYGSGHKHLVGLQFQRMSVFLMTLVVPISILWLFAEPVLAALIPDRETAFLAALYLRINILGTPSYVFFEAGKRFVQAQGLFHATTYVLLIASPVNIFLNWLLVWKLELGFTGAPVAVVLTQNLLPLLLFIYVWRVNGSQCWGGFTRRAFTNWGTMIRLALPGFIMVEAEWLAFEVLTLASGQLGTSYLAAQSILTTTAATTFQLPFPLSIAGSTRVANLIGANLVEAAKTCAKVTFVAGCLIGIFNCAVVLGIRHQLPLLFTKEPDVVAIVSDVLPFVAFMQVFDGLAAVANGLLRGIGRQDIGGYANLATYYVLALPISFGLCFGLGWKLSGLWTGVTLGLAVVAVVEYWFIYVSDWDRAARDAEHRNTNG